jgi:hypothetical protein
VHSIGVTLARASAIASIRASKVRGGFSQPRFGLGEELLDGVEVRAVSGKVSQFGACGFDGLLDPGHFVAGKIVHHDDVAFDAGWGVTMEGHLSVATIETLNKILRTAGTCCT